MKTPCLALRLLLAMIVGLCAGASSLPAQEQEARRQFVSALLRLEESVQGYSRWNSWQSQGGLTNLMREIDAGKLANPERVRANVTPLVQSFSDRFEAFRVNEAMESWLRSLETPVSIDRDRVIESAQREVTTAAAAQDALRQDLRTQMERLDRSLNRVPSYAARWRDLLRWNTLTRLAAQEPLSEQELNELETRWTLAQTHWSTLRFRYTAQTVLRAIVLARRSMLTDPESIVEEAIVRLPDSASTLDREAMAALLTLDRLDVATELSVPWHQRYAVPHCQLRIRDAALLPKFTEVVNENYAVNDYFAGTPVWGSGQTRGTMFIEPQKRASPAWNVIFQGTAVSGTVGTNSGVRVRSTAQASIRGDKIIQWRDTGLVALPATASANVSVNFNGISAGGSRGRQSIAQSEVYASRPAAERDTEMAIRSACVNRLNTHTQRLIHPINKRYEQVFTAPVNNQPVFAPRVVARRNGDHTTWNCWYTPVNGLALLSPPEIPDDEASWSLALHEDFLARHLASTYADRTIMLEELARLLGADDTSEVSASTRLRLRAVEPIEAQFRDHAVRLKLHLDEFHASNGSVHVPTTIELVYDCSVNKGKLQLARAADPIVRLDPTEATSGRTQTLKRMLLRHLDRALPEVATFNSSASPNSSGVLPAIATPIIKLSIADGWLQVSGDFADR